MNAEAVFVELIEGEGEFVSELLYAAKIWQLFGLCLDVYDQSMLLPREDWFVMLLEETICELFMYTSGLKKRVFLMFEQRF